MHKITWEQSKCKNVNTPERCISFCCHQNHCANVTGDSGHKFVLSLTSWMIETVLNATDSRGFRQYRANNTCITPRPETVGHYVTCNMSNLNSIVDHYDDLSWELFTHCWPLCIITAMHTTGNFLWKYDQNCLVTLHNGCGPFESYIRLVVVYVLHITSRLCAETDVRNIFSQHRTIFWHWYTGYNGLIYD